MSTLNDLHGKVPPPPVHVVALGHNGPWAVQAMAMTVNLATCRDRNVADYIAALWNLMPPIPEATPQVVEAYNADTVMDKIQYVPRRPYRRRKAGKSVQVMP